MYIRRYIRTFTISSKKELQKFKFIWLIQYFPKCFQWVLFYARYEAEGTIQGREQIKGGDYCACTTVSQHIQVELTIYTSAHSA